MFCENEKTIKLVVVMSAVNLWKPQKLQSRMQFTGLNCKWRFVTIAENKALSASPPRISEFSLLPSTDFPHLSQAFCTGHQYRIAGESSKGSSTWHNHCGGKTLAGGAARVSE
jgi:hypothetical protein